MSGSEGEGMEDPRPVIVLGGAGFIGRALTARLAASGIPVVAITRRAVDLGPAITGRAIGTLSAASDWPALLADGRAVVHLASRAHRPAGPSENWIVDEAALATALTRAAVQSGIERLVLLSSIKVHGETSGSVPIRASDPPAPADAYGRAKLQIEAAMARDATPRTSLTVLRPPLVYGPGVKANFLALLRLVDRGFPLPFASIENRRSLISVDNLVDLIVLCLSHPAAAGQVFGARDDEEVSTPRLIAEIARQLGRPARLFPCPPAALRGAARLLGRGNAAERLLGSLRLDDSATRKILGWQPRLALADGIAATCRWFRGGDSPARGTCL
jgi:nucleoside-diphosphate-sugar epimerase